MAPSITKIFLTLLIAAMSKFTKLKTIPAQTETISGFLKNLLIALKGCGHYYANILWRILKSKEE